MPALIGALITWCLANPACRAFLEDLFLRLFAEMFFKTDIDPAFRGAFLSLSAKLASETTEEGKRAVLIQIKALRGGS